MEQILKSDRGIADMMKGWGENYICGVHILKIIPLIKNAPIYEPMRSKKRDSTKVSTYFKYISTELDLTKDTLKEAIQEHIKNECFLNTKKYFN